MNAQPQQLTKQQQDEAMIRKNAIATVQQIEAMLPKFRMILPPHVEPERFARVCISAITQNPDLLKCTPKSILESCLVAASLGLEPNKQLGEGYFLPFWNSRIKANECQWQTGYKGFQKLARNSGEVQMIDAHAVYKDDVFEYEYGLEPKLRHIPALGERRDEDITHAWAAVKYKDGASGFRVLTRDEIEKRRRVSKQSNGPAWTGWYAEMCAKTAIRAFANMLPKSVQKAVVIENAYDMGKNPRITDYGEILIEHEALPEDEPAAQLESKPASRLESFANSGNSQPNPEDPAVWDEVVKENKERQAQLALEGQA